MIDRESGKKRGIVGFCLVSWKGRTAIELSIMHKFVDMEESVALVNGGGVLLSHSSSSSRSVLHSLACPMELEAFNEVFFDRYAFNVVSEGF